MEDFYILKNVITQGLKLGYREKETNGDAAGLDMRNGNWILSNGLDLGSSWDIIMSKDFAAIFWKEDAAKNLQELVVMTSDDRLEFLKTFIHDDTLLDVETKNEKEELYESPADALMMTIRDSLSHLKEHSIGLYKDSCQYNYDKIKDSVFKSSVVDLKEDDFILLNSVNKVMDGNLSKYLIENGKSSFTICPECASKNLIHTQGCSIEIKYNNWLLGQNIGC